MLRVQVHYYEDGNVQLQTNKEITDKVSASSPEELAKGAISIMEKAENEYQQAINENYVVMSTTTFKALRRHLPVTQCKMDWDKHLGYKLGEELARK